MKRYLTAISTLLFVLLSFNGYSEDKDLVDCFGKVRADLYKEACGKLGFTDASVINNIKNTALNDFIKSVDKAQIDENTKKQLKDIIKFNKGIEGKNSKKDYDALCTIIKDISKYLNDEALKAKYINKASLAFLEFKAYKNIRDYQKDDIDEAFAKLFPDGYFVEKYSDRFGKYLKGNSVNNSLSKIQEESRPAENKVIQTASDNKSAEQKDVEKKKGPNWTGIIIFLIIIAVCSGYIYYRYKKKSETGKQRPKTGPIVEEIPLEENPNVKKINKERGFAYDDGNVSVIGASVIGKGHISSNMPCQDSCTYINLGHGWGIAVTSDGAGSAKNSETGSKIVSTRAVEHFSKELEHIGWIENNHIPSESEWSNLSYNLIKQVMNDVKNFANMKAVELQALNATIITVIHTPFGLLVCHVGDGRAGYKNRTGEWKPIIVPHKGDEANQTVFITSDIWGERPMKISGVDIPECRVIKDQVEAFTLMSDGCESTSWQYNQLNEATGMYYDPNLPYPKFFNPLLSELKDMHEHDTDVEERLDKWTDFLKEGDNFKKETDDKTMIIGLIVK